MSVPADSPLLQEKHDLRLLIAQRIQKISASRTTLASSVNGSIPLVENQWVQREIKSFQTVERKAFEDSYRRSGPLPGHDPRGAPPGGPARTAVLDPPHRERLPAAGPVPGPGPGHVAVHPLDRLPLRAQAGQVRRRAHGPGQGHAGGHPVHDRAPRHVRRLDDGHRRLQLRRSPGPAGHAGPEGRLLRQLLGHLRQPAVRDGPARAAVHRDAPHRRRSRQVRLRAPHARPAAPVRDHPGQRRRQAGHPVPEPRARSGRARRPQLRAAPRLDPELPLRPPRPGRLRREVPGLHRLAAPVHPARRGHRPAHRPLGRHPRGHRPALPDLGRRPQAPQRAAERT